MGQPFIRRRHLHMGLWGTFVYLERRVSGVEGTSIGKDERGCVAGRGDILKKGEKDLFKISVRESDGLIWSAMKRDVKG